MSNNTKTVYLRHNEDGTVELKPEDGERIELPEGYKAEITVGSDVEFTPSYYGGGEVTSAVEVLEVRTSSDSDTPAG